VIDLRFVDYKCKDCESITEIVIAANNNCQIKCKKCGSENMINAGKVNINSVSAMYIKTKIPAG